MNDPIERDESRNTHESSRPMAAPTTEGPPPERTAFPYEEADTEPRTRRPKGFGALPHDRVVEIASKGGKAAHAAGTAHKFTSEEARAAGQKGGRATHAARRARDLREGDG